MPVRTAAQAARAAMPAVPTTAPVRAHGSYAARLGRLPPLLVVTIAAARLPPWLARPARRGAGHLFVPP